VKIEIEVPDPPKELGECEFKEAKPLRGETYHSPGVGWVRCNIDMYSTDRIVAVPKPLPPLQWHQMSRGHWQSMDYAVVVTDDGGFAAKERGHAGELSISPFTSLAAAKAACERHRLENRKTPVVADNPEVSGRVIPDSMYKGLDAALDRAFAEIGFPRAPVSPPVAEQSKPAPSLPQAWLDAGWRLKEGCRVLRGDEKPHARDLFTCYSNRPDGHWLRLTHRLERAELYPGCSVRCDDHAITCPVEQVKPETPALPDPGPGYRLVNPAVDGNGPWEYWNKSVKQWVQRVWPQGELSSDDIYRIPIAPPAPAIEWPEWAVILTKDESGMFFVADDIRYGWGWCEYTGPDPFPANADRKNCYIINPKILNK